MEILVTDLINLHASNTEFRQVFRSQQTTRLFVEAYRSFTTKLLKSPSVNERTLRLLEKVAHLGLALVVDNAVAGGQKREVFKHYISTHTIKILMNCVFCDLIRFRPFFKMQRLC